VRFPYYPRSEPLPLPIANPYADRSATIEQKVEYVWSHSIGEIVTVLATAGLRIEFLHEWPFLSWPMPFLVQHADGTWRLPESMPGEIPLSFSLRAKKA
jgi:hypothetical protein